MPTTKTTKNINYNIYLCIVFAHFVAVLAVRGCSQIVPAPWMVVFVVSHDDIVSVNRNVSILSFRVVVPMVFLFLSVSFGIVRIIVLSNMLYESPRR